MVVCNYFLQGNCRHGNSCWNDHPRDLSTATASSEAAVLVKDKEAIVAKPPDVKDQTDTSGQIHKSLLQDCGGSADVNESTEVKDLAVENMSSSEVSKIKTFTISTGDAKPLDAEITEQQNAKNNDAISECFSDDLKNENICDNNKKMLGTLMTLSDGLAVQESSLNKNYKMPWKISTSKDVDENAVKENQLKSNEVTHNKMLDHLTALPNVIDSVGTSMNCFHHTKDHKKYTDTADNCVACDIDDSKANYKETDSKNIDSSVSSKEPQNLNNNSFDAFVTKFQSQILNKNVWSFKTQVSKSNINLGVGSRMKQKKTLKSCSTKIDKMVQSEHQSLDSTRKSTEVLIPKKKKTSLERCFIHSLPKLMICFTCNRQQCAQCILTDGTCKGHTLREASNIAVRREKFKLMRDMETASAECNQLEHYVRDVHLELQTLEVKHLLRKEQIRQEFVSMFDLLIQRKDNLFRSLDEETQHRKQYLESLQKQYVRLQQSETQLTDEVTNIIQQTKDFMEITCWKKSSDCERFASDLKRAPLPEQAAVSSLLDNQFSLYLEKSHLDKAFARNSITCGELNFKRKTLYIKHTDKLVLEKLIDVPLFPTSSEQVFCVEVFNRSSRRKMWQTSVPTLKGLVLNNASTYCFGPNEIYLLRVMVRVNIEMNSTGGTVKESKPTHMMVLTEVSSMDVEDTSGSKLVDIPKLYSFEEERYIHMVLSDCPLSSDEKHPITNLIRGLPEFVCKSAGQTLYGIDDMYSFEEKRYLFNYLKFAYDVVFNNVLEGNLTNMETVFQYPVDAFLSPSME